MLRPPDAHAVERAFERAGEHARAGEWHAAQARYAEAAALDPTRWEIPNALGLLQQQRGRYDEALACFDAALLLEPRAAGVLGNRGNVLHALGRYDDALESYRRGLAIDPQRTSLHNNLALTLRRLGRSGEAIRAFERALALDPANVEAMSNLGALLRSVGRLDEAVALHRRAVALAPEHASVRSNFLLTLHYPSNVAPETVFDEHRRWGEAHEPRASAPSHTNTPDERRPLRIGYLSADFRTHSVAYFLEGIFAEHDPREFRVYAYSDVARPDATTTRFEAWAHAWRPVVGLSDGQVAALIARDEIDVLVELAGHTEDCRLGVLALRPAPVQLTYLGYPGTTGLRSIQYRLVDRWTDPPESAALSTETLVRLPHGFLVYTPPYDAPDVAPLPALRAGRVTFGSFNATSKIDDEVLSTWAAVLLRVPGSRLLLKGQPFADPEVRRRYVDAFARHGVDATRLELRPWEAARTSHLAVYGEVDLALDTFPYNGTTTTCEALWMGVPVVSLVGRAHAARVGLSLLSRLGRPEWAAATRDAYVEQAALLAGDLDRLAELRRTLRATVVERGLTDGASFTDDLERVYREAWIGWCRGLPPATLSARLEVPAEASAREPRVSRSALSVAELALLADATGKLRRRREAAAYARRAYEALRRGEPEGAVPPLLLLEWGAPSVEGLLLRQCLSYAADSMFFEREGPRELLLRWAELEPTNAEAYFRFGLLFALEARAAGKPVPAAVRAAFEAARAFATDPRFDAALALAGAEQPSLTLAFQGTELSVPGTFTHAGTFALLEQGDWYDPDLAVLRLVLDDGDRVLDLDGGVGAYAVSAALVVGARGAVTTVASSPAEAPFLRVNAARHSNVRVVSRDRTLAGLFAEAAPDVVRLRADSGAETDVEALIAAARSLPATLFVAQVVPGSEPRAACDALARAGHTVCFYYPGRHAFAPWTPGAIDGHALLFAVRPEGLERLSRVAPVLGG